MPTSILGIAIRKTIFFLSLRSLLRTAHGGEVGASHRLDLTGTLVLVFAVR